MITHHVIAKYSGMQFTTFVQQRLFSDLNMTSTTYSPIKAEESGLMSHYWAPDGRRIPFYNHGNMHQSQIGVNGVISNAVDMVRICIDEHMPLYSYLTTIRRNGWNFCGLMARVRVRMLHSFLILLITLSPRRGQVSPTAMEQLANTPKLGKSMIILMWVYFSLAPDNFLTTRCWLGDLSFWEPCGSKFLGCLLSERCIWDRAPCQYRKSTRTEVDIWSRYWTNVWFLSPGRSPEVCLLFSSALLLYWHYSLGWIFPFNPGMSRRRSLGILRRN